MNETFRIVVVDVKIALLHLTTAADYLRRGQQRTALAMRSIVVIKITMIVIIILMTINVLPDKWWLLKSSEVFDQVHYDKLYMRKSNKNADNGIIQHNKLFRYAYFFHICYWLTVSNNTFVPLWRRKKTKSHAIRIQNTFSLNHNRRRSSNHYDAVRRDSLYLISVMRYETHKIRPTFKTMKHYSPCDKWNLLWPVKAFKVNFKFHLNNLVKSNSSEWTV